MCEGSNEKTIINILLKYNKLIFNNDDLVGIEPYSVKKLKNIITVIKPVNSPIEIYRIGDTMTDKLFIPNVLSHMISQNRISKYHTKPELEILLIINENLLKEYEKVKSKMSAKSFAKAYIYFNGKKYDNSCSFYEEYYDSKERVNLLVDNLIEYKRIKKHNKNEFFLADLLK